MAPPRRREPSAAARRRIEQALTRHGLLLVQGQDVVPSLADLLANRPITTRGYSWDYEPAWRMRFELEARADVASVKLLRGKVTLVLERLWPAVRAVARAARTSLPSTEIIDELEAAPGITVERLCDATALDKKAVVKALKDLERWCCAFSRERDDVGYHTHEQAWYPWSQHPIAKAGRAALAHDDAVDALFEAAGRAEPPARLYPVIALRDRGARRARP
jgi:hypothetical protein